VHDTRDPLTVDIAPNRQLISQALAQLPPEYRAVLRRAYYDARSTAEIADDLHIEEGSVKSSLHYALRALLLNLQEKGVAG
jgi:RNA polymerase sigma-70 factor, ECF subfamily